MLTPTLKHIKSSWKLTQTNKTNTDCGWMMLFCVAKPHCWFFLFLQNHTFTYLLVSCAFLTLLSLSLFMLDDCACENRFIYILGNRHDNDDDLNPKPKKIWRKNTQRPARGTEISGSFDVDGVDDLQARKNTFKNARRLFIYHVKTNA